jgi:hypothetical protein
MKTAFLSVSSLAIALGLGLTGCSEKKDPSPAAAQQSDSGSLVSAPTDYLSAAAKAKQSAEKKIDVTALNAALEQFNVGEGRYPKDLNELVTKKYITMIPTTPHGTKLEYDATAGQVKIVPQ